MQVSHLPRSSIYIGVLPFSGHHVRAIFQTLDSAVSQRRLVREDMNHPRLENELRLSMAPLQGNQMHGFLVTRTLQVRVR